ncbi:MAG: hypothetical protein DRJ69_07065 [Thermoprotei archaeon]|nr:MAG: hypothetical protein DRJ69_07065 [Thermoprotei archaeon]
MAFGEAGYYEAKKEISLKAFMDELKTVINSSPIKLLEVVGEEAKEFTSLDVIADAVAKKLEITTENAQSLLRLTIMLRLVEYDDLEDKVRALDPLTRFVARIRRNTEILEKLGVL